VLDADPVRLSQVFNNLVNNASKFSDAGGTISITATCVDGVVQVSVKDSGIGIAPQKLNSIFDMFEQVDKSIGRTRGGLGIGLTLAKRLVELHDGQISAASAGIGQGCEFVVRLPGRQESVARPVERAPGTPVAQRRNILVTDDNRDAANSLAMLLKLGGHQVITAFDGLEAVQKAEVARPDLILLDIGLPGMDGYAVCRLIRQQPWGKDIQIVAVTGWGQEQDRTKTRAAGFDQHLVKPVEKTAMESVLNAAP
jgi:CheY-like chemotaxis protein